MDGDLDQQLFKSLLKNYRISKQIYYTVMILILLQVIILIGVCRTGFKQNRLEKRLNTIEIEVKNERT
jgi:hypothetical protein